MHSTPLPQRSEPLRIGLIGATGKFGRSIALAALSHPGIDLCAAVTHSQSEFLHQDVGLFLKIKPLGIFFTADPQKTPVDLWIDVSTSEALSHNLQVALAWKKPFLIGTTGLSPLQLQEMHTASSHIPLFYAPNFSLGMALFQKIAAEIALRFSADCHIDLIESHHAEKKDAPSGSALLLSEKIHQARPKASVSIHSLRTGKIVGEHTLRFNTAEEEITITHKAHTKELFAQGALRAALFLSKQPPGFYTMDHLL